MISTPPMIEIGYRLLATLLLYIGVRLYSVVDTIIFIKNTTLFSKGWTFLVTDFKTYNGTTYDIQFGNFQMLPSID